MSSLKLSILGPLLAFILLFVGIIAVGISHLQESRDHRAVETAHDILRVSLETRIADQGKIMEAALAALAGNARLQDLFLSADRQGLLDATLPLFETLRERHRITHFYFTGTDHINVLRVHQPDRFGDVIDRKTMLMAVRANAVGKGLERGPLGTYTLRVVMPWIKDGRLIGYLEMGAEIDHIVSATSQSLGLPIFTFTAKRGLDRAQWEEGERMLDRTPMWDQFDDIVSLSGGDLPPGVVEHVRSSGLDGPSIVYDLKSNGALVSLIHAPVLNVNGQPVVTAIALYDETAGDRNRILLTAFIVAISLAVGAALIFVFWMILQRVEGRIKDYETVLIAAKEEAEASNTAKSQFLATMSHELRTPLNAILGFSEMMKMQIFGALGAQKYVEYTNDIHNSAEHLLALINDILHISKIEAGQQTMRMTNIDINALVEESVHFVEPRAHDGQVTLINAVAPSMPPLTADQRAVKQGLINILTNAVKFTPATGKVTVSAEATAKWYDLAIADTGIGISQKDMKKLTQPFTQIERNTTGRVQEGTGLGLAITRNLMEMHGGKLMIESEVGIGTTVTLRFPRGQVD